MENIMNKQTKLPKRLLPFALAIGTCQLYGAGFQLNVKSASGLPGDGIITHNSAVFPEKLTTKIKRNLIAFALAFGSSQLYGTTLHVYKPSEADDDNLII